MTTDQEKIAQAAEESVNRNMLELNEADARVRHFKMGANFGIELGRQAERNSPQVKALVEALDALTVAGLAQLKPLPRQVQAGFDALAQFKDISNV